MTDRIGAHALVLLALVVATPARSTDDASELLRAGRYADALAAARQDVEQSELRHGPSSEKTGTALIILARASERAGRATEALVAAQRATALFEVSDVPSAERARAYSVLSEAQRTLGDYSNAVGSADRGVREAELAGGANSAAVARALVVLAEAKRASGDFAAALSAASRALAIDEIVAGESPETAESLNQLGLVHASLRDTSAAKPLYARAFRIRENVLGPKHPRTAESLNNLAALEWADRDLDGAAEHMTRSLAIKREALGDGHPSTAIALNNLAEIERARGNGDEAIGLMRQAVQVWQDALGAHHPLTSTARFNLATFYWLAGQYAEARPLLEESAVNWRENLGPSHPDTARAENLLAAFYQSIGEYRHALELYRSGLSAEDEVLVNVFSVTSEEQKLRFLELTQGHYFAALSLVQRHFAGDDDAVRFALELVLRRKGIVLDVQARTQDALRNRLSGDTRAAWERLSLYRSDLAKLLLQGPGMREASDYRAEVERLQVAIAAEERRLRGDSGLIAGEIAQRRASIKAVAARLPADSVLAEFVRVRDWDERRARWSNTDRYLAFVVDRGATVTMVDLGEADAIDRRIDEALSAIKDPRLLESVTGYVERSDEALSALYQVLWRPLRPSLAGRTRVILGPDGELNRVPFAALRTPDSKYLVETTALSHVSTGRDLLGSQEKGEAAVDLFLVANPAFDHRSGGGTGPAIRSMSYRGFRYPPLPGTADEAIVIPKLLAGRVIVLQNEKATESAVREAPPAAIVHFATHGFFLQEDTTVPDRLARPGGLVLRGGAAGPMVRSGLAFAGANHATSITEGDDGILTALEVSGLDLHATDLVVLSACETALGDIAIGQGVYGLRRAFVLAGAGNLVMSLWQVNDKITRDLMERFYRSYATGVDPADALRAAQLQTVDFLRKRTATAVPGGVAPINLWAPFILQQSR